MFASLRSCTHFVRTARHTKGRAVQPLGLTSPAKPCQRVFASTHCELCATAQPLGTLLCATAQPFGTFVELTPLSCATAQHFATSPLSSSGHLNALVSKKAFLRVPGAHYPNTHTTATAAPPSLGARSLNIAGAAHTGGQFPKLPVPDASPLFLFSKLAARDSTDLFCLCIVLRTVAHAVRFGARHRCTCRATRRFSSVGRVPKCTYQRLSAVP